MLHCKTARLGTSTPSNKSAIAPGIFTAKTLQGVLSATLLSGRQQDESCDEIVSPYGRILRQTRKPRYKYCQNDLVTFRLKHDIVVRRKKCRKLDPIMPQDQLKVIAPFTDNQTSNEAHAALDQQQLEQLRLGLLHINSKQQRDMNRLQSEIQWIHGHFPVLKLANAKCSRTLRHQLFKNAIIHVSIHFLQRKALMIWYRKLLEAQRMERLQLKASRQLIAMFKKVSFERVAVKFNSWRMWILQCQAQEEMAAAITLQHFARFIHCCHEEKVSSERKVALNQAYQVLSRNAMTIQRIYCQHLQRVQQRHYEAVARKKYCIEMRRTAHNEFIRQQNAAKILQQRYKVYSKYRSHKRSTAIAELLERSQDRQARRIQSSWFAYILWRDVELPQGIVKNLVDQVEFLDAVVSIQRHLRGFQCRSQLKKLNCSAFRIQRCYRDFKRRVPAKRERERMQLRRDIAASYLQRTYKRTREERKVYNIVRQSVRPMYLRARQLGESFRERFRVPIAKSAVIVIQTTWRRHIVYETEKQRRLKATTNIQKFLKRRGILSKWHNFVLEAPRNHRNAAAGTIQHWKRRLHRENIRSRYSKTCTVDLVVYLSSAVRIQRWYRRLHCDSWRFLDFMLAKELPKCIEAVNRIGRWWRKHFARRNEQLHRVSTLADFIEQQRRLEVENRAACCVQKMFKRMIDRRDGKLLLHKYKILLREDMKRRQQRAIVHKYLEEKSQQRKKKQETKATNLSTQGAATMSSVSSPQTLMLNSNTSAFPLDRSSFNINDVGWQTPSNDVTSPSIESPIQYWSDEYQRAYLYDPVTGISTWL